MFEVFEIIFMFIFGVVGYKDFVFDDDWVGSILVREFCFLFEVFVVVLGCWSWVVVVDFIFIRVVKM